VKRYVDDRDTAGAVAILDADLEWITARHTYVEVTRALGATMSGAGLAAVRAAFEHDWARTAIVELDAAVCQRAAELALMLEVRTLDALHLGAAERAGGASIPVVTFDRRLAAASRRLGWTVLGA
jgi:predicted nucleic acid-binding protein